MEGVGKLTAQKILHCSTMLGLVEDERLLGYYIPGSDVHLKHLKESFEFEYSGQPTQLLRLLMYRRKFPATKAEEGLCCTLKPDHTKDIRQDVLLRGEPLF